MKSILKKPLKSKNKRDAGKRKVAQIQKTGANIRIFKLNGLIRKEFEQQKGRRKPALRKQDKKPPRKEVQETVERRNEENRQNYSQVQRVLTHQNYERPNNMDGRTRIYKNTERQYQKPAFHFFSISDNGVEEMAHYKAISGKFAMTDTARWEVYAKSRQKISDVSEPGQIRYGLITPQATGSQLIERTETYAGSSGSSGIELKVESPKFETVQNRSEKNVLKPQLSMEEQMARLQKYEAGAAGALQSYHSGSIDAKSASIIESVKQKIGYKGSCCDAKLVNALVEYQEAHGVELRVKK